MKSNSLFNFTTDFLKKRPLKKCIIILFVLAVFGIALLLKPDNTSSPTVVRNPIQKQFCDFSNNIFSQTLSGDSLSLSFYVSNPSNYGLDESPQTLGSYTFDSLKASQKYYISLINSLKKFDYSQLSTLQKITYDTMLSSFQNQLDFSDLCLCSEVLSPTTGVQAQLPILFSEYKFYSKRDVENYLSLLSQLPSYFEQICEFQVIKAKHKSFIDQQTCNNIISQCKDFLSDKDETSHFLSISFNNKLRNVAGLSSNEVSDYIKQNHSIIKEKVFTAYENIINTLSKLIAQKKCVTKPGLCNIPLGKDYYEFLVKNYVGSSKSVLEIKAAIQSQLVKDTKAMYSIISGSKEFEQAFYEDLDKYKAIKKKASPSEILAYLSEQASKDFPLDDTINYTIKYVDKSLENHLSPAFYLAPPIDIPENNTIYINNSHLQTSDLFVTLAHEGIPGHMLQSHTFMKSNPLPIRHILNFGGYCEGWATYVELFSYKYEYKNSALADALSSSASYSLALYSLCDIGINYQGWTYKDTKKFLSTYNINDDSTCKSIFQAVVEDPANYLQYYAGYLEICELKKEVQEKLGKEFNLQKFHRAFLLIGPTDFQTVRKWIYTVYNNL